MFFKKEVLKKFAKLTGKYLCYISLLIKLQAQVLKLYLKETPAQAFFCELNEISHKAFFYRTPRSDLFYFLYTQLIT